MVAIEQPTRPKQRGQLSRELILDATRNLLDEHGLEALSMRAVANAVGSSPMALYRYVSDRRDLEIAVAQLVSVELELIDDPTVAPDEAIATWMR
ncbi:MAG: TetR/AcrR family transcriptional regulator, partial [Acidimicrobiia bacterium]|nr:TetR/AcrR family transcriptional regulator [Acidimicrobiia bacterium]